MVGWQVKAAESAHGGCYRNGMRKHLQMCVLPVAALCLLRWGFAAQELVKFIKFGRDYAAIASSYDQNSILLAVRGPADLD